MRAKILITGLCLLGKMFAFGQSLYHENYRPQFHFSPTKIGPMIPMDWSMSMGNTICFSIQSFWKCLGAYELGTCRK